MLLLVEHRAVARSPESRGYLVKYCRSDMVPAPVPAGGGACSGYLTSKTHGLSVLETQLFGL